MGGAIRQISAEGVAIRCSYVDSSEGASVKRRLCLGSLQSGYCNDLLNSRSSSGCAILSYTWRRTPQIVSDYVTSRGSRGQPISTWNTGILRFCLTQTVTYGRSLFCELHFLLETGLLQSPRNRTWVDHLLLPFLQLSLYLPRVSLS